MEVHPQKRMPAAPWTSFYFRLCLQAFWRQIYLLNVKYLHNLHSWKELSIIKIRPPWWLHIIRKLVAQWMLHKLTHSENMPGWHCHMNQPTAKSLCWLLGLALKITDIRCPQVGFSSQKKHIFDSFQLPRAYWGSNFDREEHNQWYCLLHWDSWLPKVVQVMKHPHPTMATVQPHMEKKEKEDEQKEKQSHCSFIAILTCTAHWFLLWMMAYWPSLAGRLGPFWWTLYYWQTTQSHSSQYNHHRYSGKMFSWNYCRWTQVHTSNTVTHKMLNSPLD